MRALALEAEADDSDVDESDNSVVLTLIFGRVRIKGQNQVFQLDKTEINPSMRTHPFWQSLLHSFFLAATKSGRKVTATPKKQAPVSVPKPKTGAKRKSAPVKSKYVDDSSEEEEQSESEKEEEEEEEPPKKKGKQTPG